MTTIAFRDNILAADTQLTIGDIRTKCTKIRKLNKNTIIACAGNTNAEYKAHQYFNQPDWRNKEPPEIKKDFECIVIYKGIAYACNKSLYPSPIEHPFFAIGSGWQLSMAGMHTGMSAIESIKFAAELNIYTNNEVEWINVREETEKAQGKGKKEA